MFMLHYITLLVHLAACCKKCVEHVTFTNFCEQIPVKLRHLTSIKYRYISLSQHSICCSIMLLSLTKIVNVNSMYMYIHTF